MSATLAVTDVTRSASTPSLFPKRFVYLDGIRGLAALFVLTRHTQALWHVDLYRSYLAVDVFFLLSGFVIAHAYDGKLRRGIIAEWRFVFIRLIRLYPMYVLSFAVAAAVFIAEATRQGQRIDPWLLTCSAFLLPYKMSGSADFFPLNGPSWSLFYELIVNCAYGLARRMLTDRVLAAVVLTSGLFVVAVAIRHGNLDVGFTWSLTSIGAGLFRATFGIALGLLLHRHWTKISGALARSAGTTTSWLAVAALLLVLASPSVPDVNAVVDVLAVILIFPLCVALAALSNQGGRSGSILLALGAASYPVYLLHLPLGVAAAYLLRHFVDGWRPYAGILFVAVLIPTTIWLEQAYDLPVRRWLTVRMNGRFDKGPNVASGAVIRP